MEVTCEGKPIIGSPFTIPVRPTTEPEKVRLAGAGIRGPVQASMPSTFTVDATEAGLGDIKLDVMVRPSSSFFKASFHLISFYYTYEMHTTLVRTGLHKELLNVKWNLKMYPLWESHRSLPVCILRISLILIRLHVR